MEVFGVAHQITEKTMGLDGKNFKSIDLRVLIKYQLLIFIVLFFLLACQTKTERKNSKQTENVSANVLPTPIDTLIKQLEINVASVEIDINSLGIDSFYSHFSGQTVYLDSSVHINDSVFYSIIDISDSAGVCSHSFVVTINEKTKKVISSKYLLPDCDIDFGQDTYDLYDYKIISKNTIKVTKTTVFQKKDRQSANEDENIDHKEIQEHYFTISSEGFIKDR